MAPIVVNGDFESANPTNAARPLGWDVPDGLGVVWTDAPREATGVDHGKAIRIDTRVTEKRMVAQWRKRGITKWDIPNASGGPVAATYGLSFYSQSMPVASGQAYRVSCDIKSPGRGEGAKLWVRCYGQFRGRLRRRYESVLPCTTASGEWTTLTQVLFPTRYRPDVTEMKIMLYAYWPAGVYWFDNVQIEPIPVETYEKERVNRRTHP